MSLVLKSSGGGSITISEPVTASNLTQNIVAAAGSIPVADSDSIISTGSGTGTLCRAWVNFNGTGTVAIRASFNVSSITDLGTGLYHVNFTTAMPNINYAACTQATGGTTMGANDVRHFISTPINNYTTGYLYVGVVNTANTAFVDATVVNVSIFR